MILEWHTGVMKWMNRLLVRLLKHQRTFITGTAFRFCSRLASSSLYSPFGFAWYQFGLLLQQTAVSTQCELTRRQSICRSIIALRPSHRRPPPLLLLYPHLDRVASAPHGSRLTKSSSQKSKVEKKKQIHVIVSSDVFVKCIA